MKRSTKPKPMKLQLDRQTIRDLALEDCDKVRGGSPTGTSTRPNCQTSD